MTLESFENWTLFLARTRFFLSFAGDADGKETCQDDRVQVCLLSYLSKELLIFLGQNISNLCQSIFVFLTVYCEKLIFKLESYSIRLRVSFFIALRSQINTAYNVEGQSQHPSPKG